MKSYLPQERAVRAIEEFEAWVYETETETETETEGDR